LIEFGFARVDEDTLGMKIWWRNSMKTWLGWWRVNWYLGWGSVECL